MKNRVVSFHYVLKNQSGELLDSSREEGGEPLSYIEGQQQIIPGLEKALKSLKLGDKKKVTVMADEAYGQYEEGLKMTLPIDKFPKDEKVEEGDQFRMRMPDSDARIFTVTAVTPTHITVDGNHPLAGQDLHFDVEITESREATADDLKATEHEHHEGCNHEHH